MTAHHPIYNNSLFYQEPVVLFLALNKSTPFCSQYEDGKWYCYILLVVFTFALPMGILGNVAALLYYTCFRRTSTTSTIFLLNLTLCDSAWILTLPFTLYFSLQQPYVKDIHTFCQLKKIFFNINIYGSILFITLISFDRYAGTVHPISSLKWWGVGKARVCSACAWALLILGSIPDLFVTFAVRRPGNVTVCMDQIRGPFVYVKTITVIRTLVGFALPFCVMLVCYVMTVRVLRGLPWGKGRGGGGGAGQRLGKPMLLITAALLVFVVSFVPYHIMIITLVFMRIHKLVTPANVSVLYAAYEFFESLCSVSSCLDPVLYILASESFQRRLQAFRRGPHCCRARTRVGVEE